MSSPEAPPPPSPGLPDGAVFCGRVRWHRNELRPSGVMVSQVFPRIAAAARSKDQTIYVYSPTTTGSTKLRKFEGLRLGTSGGKWRISGATPLIKNLGLPAEAKHVALWRMPDPDDRLFIFGCDGAAAADGAVDDEDKAADRAGGQEEAAASGGAAQHQKQQEQEQQEKEQPGRKRAHKRQARQERNRQLKQRRVTRSSAAAAAAEDEGEANDGTEEAAPREGNGSRDVEPKEQAPGVGGGQEGDHEDEARGEKEDGAGATRMDVDEPAGQEQVPTPAVAEDTAVATDISHQSQPQAAPEGNSQPDTQPQPDSAAPHEATNDTAEQTSAADTAIPAPTDTTPQPDAAAAAAGTAAANGGDMAPQDGAGAAVKDGTAASQPAANGSATAQPEAAATAVAVIEDAAKPATGGDVTPQCRSRVEVTADMMSGGYLVLDPCFATCAGLSVDGPASAASAAIELLEPDGTVVRAVLALTVVVQEGDETTGNGGEVGGAAPSAAVAELLRVNGSGGGADGAAAGAQLPLSLKGAVVLGGLADWMQSRALAVESCVVVVRTVEGLYYITIEKATGRGHAGSGGVAVPGRDGARATHGSAGGQAANGTPGVSGAAEEGAGQKKTAGKSAASSAPPASKAGACPGAGTAAARSPGGQRGKRRTSHVQSGSRGAAGPATRAQAASELAAAGQQPAAAEAAAPPQCGDPFAAHSEAVARVARGNSAVSVAASATHLLVAQLMVKWPCQAAAGAAAAYG